MWSSSEEGLILLALIYDVIFRPDHLQQSSPRPLSMHVPALIPLVLRDFWPYLVSISAPILSCQKCSAASHIVDPKRIYWSKRRKQKSRSVILASLMEQMTSYGRCVLSFLTQASPSSSQNPLQQLDMLLHQIGYMEQIYYLRHFPFSINHCTATARHVVTRSTVFVISQLEENVS